MDDTTYVIGHKNPDADAICAAIAYADYKRASGHTGYVAARCGNSNPRVDAILKRFERPLPQFIGDVTPRIRDIMVGREAIHSVASDATCSEALQIIDAYDLRALPVLDPGEGFAGYISFTRLAEYFVPKPGEMRALRRVHTSIRKITEALGAKILNEMDPERIEEMLVRVGAMDIRSYGRSQEGWDSEPGQMAVIVGDRWDIQEKSIQMGVRLLVISGGLEVDAGIVENARASGVSVIVSPLDSASTAWIIRTATRSSR